MSYEPSLAEYELYEHLDNIKSKLNEIIKLLTLIVKEERRKNK